MDEYLDQFRVHKEEVLYKRLLKDSYYNDRELEFQEAKLKFLIFMSQKKRTNEEIIEFLKPFESWIKSRLESIQLIKLSSNEIELTKKKIDELKASGKQIRASIKIQETQWKSIKKDWERNNKSKAKQSSLVGQTSEERYNGIEVWNPEEAIKEMEETEVESETNIEE